MGIVFGGGGWSGLHMLAGSADWTEFVRRAAATAGTGGLLGTAVVVGELLEDKVG